MNALSKDRLDYIAAGCSAVMTALDAKTTDHEFEVRKAIKLGHEIPTSDLPRVARSSWVSWAATKLGENNVPAWFRDVDLREGFEDLVGPVLRKLRAFPEFRTWVGEVLELRWTRKPIVVRDMVLEEAVAGRVKAVGVVDRMVWSGDGPAPAFRLELSLPWWLLASDEEQEHGLHAVIAACGMDDGPVIRKPDIVAHASTLGRYGIGGIRQAQAIAHAVAHPSHTRVLRDHGFDPASGQGLIWGAIEGAQTNLVDTATKVGRGLHGKTSRSTTPKKPKNPPPKLAAVEDLPDEPEN